MIMPFGKLTSANGSKYRHGNKIDRNLPAPVTVVSNSSWHEKMELRVKSQLKKLEPESSAWIEGTEVTRLTTRRQALYLIGGMRYVLDQAAWEIVRQVEAKGHE